MKKLIVMLASLLFISFDVTAKAPAKDTFVVCTPIQSTNKSQLFKCELIDAKSLRSIDVWTATLNP